MRKTDLGWSRIGATSSCVLEATTELMALFLICFTSNDLAAMPDLDPALLAEQQLFVVDRLNAWDF
jgi:hypothetical protein